MAQCRLTERIVIEKFSETQNENGFDEVSWTEYHPCWSGYIRVSGKEYIAAKATNSENIVTFTVRYCNKVKELLKPGASKIFRVKYKDNYYDIDDALDFENLHTFVDIKAKINC
ncbi:MAG: phage head closure protein [Peptostreptococcaceae bacterium]